MNFSWGSTELKIVVGSIEITPSPSGLTESALLPDRNALGAISTVVQQQGRKRGRVGAKLYVQTRSEYDAFVTDKDSGTVRDLNIIVGEISGNYKIESVGKPELIRYSIILFDVTWLEEVV